MGLAADAGGFVYCTTGNGICDANTGGRDYGDSVLKLRPNLTLSDYFTPSDQPTLQAQDIDLGSGGVLILPDPPAGTQLLPLLVTCGKDGNIFLINRDAMGGYTTGGPDHVVQTVPLQPGVAFTAQPGVWGGPGYYRGPNGQFVYYCGNSGDHLKAFLLQKDSLTLGMVGAQPNQSPSPFPGEGGTTPTVSSNQQAAGSGVVWAIARQNPLRLQAYDANNLTHQLFAANAGPWNNPNGGPFVEATVINGKLYVGSDGQLSVFGVLH
jgi:hypothetical protein